VPSPWLALAGAIASAALGALFAGADTALTSLTSTRLEALIDQAVGADKHAYERIQRDDAKLRSRYLLGRITCTVVTAICVLDLLEETIPAPGAAWVSLLVTIVLTAIFFEASITLARKHADRAALLAARWFRPLELAMIPLAVPVGWMGSRLGRKDGEQSADPRVAEAEVEALVDEGERSGVLASEPAEMIRNVLDFADRTAKDVMIPRDELEGIEVETPLADVLKIVAESGHSRYPVYREQIDNIVGLLYAKDLFKAAHFDEDPSSKRPVRNVDDLVRKPANFVAESQPLSSLLREMRQRRQHLAIVVDEFGSVCGIVTLEDVLEEIVGDIHDEHDVPIEDLGDGRVVADATVSMKELCAHLGADLGTASEDESLGAMLTLHLGKVPEVGTAFSKFGLRFVVRDSDEKHVGKVEVARV
jgi:CBS domain containing-hemolysin-like protein